MQISRANEAHWRKLGEWSKLQTNAGSKSRRGTEVAAVLYSMIESAKLVGINPEEYFKTAIKAHFDGIEIPLPHEVAAKA